MDGCRRFEVNDRLGRDITDPPSCVAFVNKNHLSSRWRSEVEKRANGDNINPVYLLSEVVAVVRAIERVTLQTFH